MLFPQHKFNRFIVTAIVLLAPQPQYEWRFQVKYIF